MDKGVFRYDTDKTRLGAPPATPLDVEACVRLLDDLIVMLAPHDAQSIADANQLRALKLALPGMGKDSERLDWLNGRLNWFTTQGPGHDPQYRDIRERIDAAQTMTPEYRAARAAQPQETSDAG